jgi:hypothetical protein
MCVLTAQLYSQDTGKHDEAIRSAESFLSLIDENKYQDTWTWLSDVFKKTITKEQLVGDLEGVRKPLGKLLERKLSHVTEASDENLGEYLIVQYQSLFENKESKSEAVSVIKDIKGRWKILGYTIF